MFFRRFLRGGVSLAYEVNHSLVRPFPSVSLCPMSDDFQDSFAEQDPFQVMEPPERVAIAFSHGDKVKNGKTLEKKPYV